MNSEMQKLKKLMDKFLFVEYGCVFCGRECADTLHNVCDACKEDVYFIDNVHLCDKCGMILKNDFANICSICKTAKYAFTSARAVVVYDSFSSSAIFKLKYEKKKNIAKYLARLMTEKFWEWNINVDMLCFVPLHCEKQKERGFNQAELIANEIGKLIKFPVVDTLVRKRSTESQTKLGSKSRKENLKNAFAYTKDGRTCKGKSVLLIDDVFTTGATLNECSKQLIKAGARNVYCLTFAKVMLDV